MKETKLLTTAVESTGRTEWRDGRKRDELQLCQGQVVIIRQNYPYNFSIPQYQLPTSWRMVAGNTSHSDKELQVPRCMTSLVWWSCDMHSLPRWITSLSRQDKK
ncbi:predicted protein [Histoplasma capsulatum G186AR]|uniref:Uncharacterized protein n=1 Tax=Ajellomyces capsulatus (strain G186AR / H82 / ATCC MYA-2454 / RMSCC 2432) TaxID=447093 RepID=C0NZM6_AJECG|nr:uncharacterized protein HCBG_08606 [Histoplasma capsulatum G186AR]EEH03274.1 predicted protein [Histoplasma capsulatum G186AR]